MNWSSLLMILFGADAILAMAAVVSVLRRPREPRAMLAWILTLLFVPVVGLAAFFLIGDPRVHRTRTRRRRLARVPCHLA